MKYIEFRDRIKKKLIRNPQGLTWTELRYQLALPMNDRAQHGCKNLKKKSDSNEVKAWVVHLFGKYLININECNLT